MDYNTLRFFGLQGRLDGFDLALHDMKSFLEENRENIKKMRVYWDEVLSQNRHYIYLLEEINKIIEEALKEKIEVIP